MGFSVLRKNIGNPDPQVDTVNNIAEDEFKMKI